MVMKKRGLSEVVTVALIILLAIAAVVIVWTFVRSTLEDVGKQVTSDCVTTNIKAISCGDSAIVGVQITPVRVEYVTGKDKVSGVKLSYYDANGVVLGTVDATGCATAATPIAVGSIVTCTGSLPAGVTAGSIAKVAVGAMVGDKVCPVISSKVDCV